jgi:hypothetical protein
LTVHGTVLSQCRLAVLTQNISVYELTCLDWAAISRWVSKVVHILCVASLSAESCVERSGSENFGSDESVITQGIVWSVDSCVSEKVGV